VRKLPAEQAMQLLHWLVNYLEDEAELNPELVVSLQGPALKFHLRQRTLVR
jgi:hypothetical protein